MLLIHIPIDDLPRIERALRMRAKALYNLADENTRRAPDLPHLAAECRHQGDELSRIADDLAAQPFRAQRDTDIAPAMSDEEAYSLFSTPPEAS